MKTLHEMLDAILKECDRNAMPSPYLAIIDKAGKKFIDAQMARDIKELKGETLELLRRSRPNFIMATGEKEPLKPEHAGRRFKTALDEFYEFELVEPFQRLPKNSIGVDHVFYGRVARQVETRHESLFNAMRPDLRESHFQGKKCWHNAITDHYFLITGKTLFTWSDRLKVWSIM
jgi:hypothetical protein